MQTPRKNVRSTLRHRLGSIQFFNLLFAACAAGIVGLLLACGSTNSQQNPTPITAPVTDVYLAGYESNGSNDVAKYWKDGVPVTLTDGTKEAQATSIAVSGSDVYVAGVEGSVPKDAYTAAMYWKNGAAVVLKGGTGSARANAIAVSGSDVYVAGWYDYTPAISDPGRGGTLAILWKNGVAIPLPDDGKGSGANAVFVVGSDVYVAGYFIETNQTAPVSSPLYKVAVCWKNGVPLGFADGLRGSEASSIFVSGKDVYVAGNLYGYTYSSVTPTYSQAMYWKNGQAGMLMSNSSGVALSIYVSGADVYVTGRNLSPLPVLAQYWKNGVVTKLTETGTASADQIVVSGNDVYAGGTVWNDLDNTYHANYWKNGLATALSNGPNNSRATSIAVVPH